MLLDQLRYFIEVADYNSLNKAAQKLYITQSALTQSINSLEEQLGFKLLERTATGTYLTAFGETVYQDCQEIFCLLAEKEEKWSKYAVQQKKSSGASIGIVAVPVLCDNIVGELVSALAMEHPDLDLFLYEAIGLEVLDVLRKRARIGVSYDLSFGNEKVKSFAQKHAMQMIPVLEDQYRFFVAQDHPLLRKEQISLADLREWSLINKSSINGAVSDVLPLDYVNLPTYFNRIIGTPNTDVMMNLLLEKKR